MADVLLRFLHGFCIDFRHLIAKVFEPGYFRPVVFCAGIGGYDELGRFVTFCDILRLLSWDLKHYE